MLVELHGSVAEGDGVAEASFPPDRPLARVHHDLASFGAGMEEQRADGPGAPGAPGAEAPGRRAPPGFVVTSVRRGRYRAAEGV